MELYGYYIFPTSNRNDELCSIMYYVFFFSYDQFSYHILSSRFNWMINLETENLVPDIEYADEAMTPGYKNEIRPFLRLLLCTIY